MDHSFHLFHIYLYIYSQYNRFTHHLSCHSCTYTIHILNTSTFSFKHQNSFQIKLNVLLKFCIRYVLKWRCHFSKGTWACHLATSCPRYLMYIRYTYIHTYVYTSITCIECKLVQTLKSKPIRIINYRTQALFIRILSTTMRY